MHYAFLSSDHNSRGNTDYIRIVNSRLYSASVCGVIQVSALDQESRFPSPVTRQGKWNEVIIAVTVRCVCIVPSDTSTPRHIHMYLSSSSETE
jgi:hypothetical protein